jgi:DNA (cytosine-5)-methyltransferase 1
MWFLMENVRQSPEPRVAGYSTHSFLLNNCDLPAEDGLGHEQIRERRFTWGTLPGGPKSIVEHIERAALRLPKLAPTVLSRTDPSGAMVPVALGGSGKPKRTLQRTVTNRPVVNTKEAKRKKSIVEIVGERSKGIRAQKPAVTAAHSGQDGRPNGGHLVVYDVREALRLQGLPEDYLDDCPLTKTGKMKAIANGVPIPMGRAVARAIRVATGHRPMEAIS